MSIEFLDPSHEADAAAFRMAQGLTTLDGSTVALLSNGKEGTRPFFDAFENALITGHGVRQVIRLTKNNYSAPAEPAILEQAVRCDAIIAGIGD